MSEGWVCIAFDSDIGSAVEHTIAYENAIDKILLEWPAFKQWTNVIGGSSGGSKAALLRVTVLLAKGVPMKGVFLTGCNSGKNLEKGRDQNGVSKSELRDVSCFISSGKSDGQVTRVYLDSVISAVKDAGMKTVREEWFDVGHEINHDQFAEALKWFASASPK